MRQTAQLESAPERSPVVKKKRTLFLAEYLLTPDKRINNAAILCESDRIVALGGESSFTRESGVEEIHIPGAYATSGFIDSHIHGAGGFDCSSVADSPNRIDAMSRMLAERGVTAFVPTVVADQRDRMLENLHLLSTLLDQPVPGAIPVGINVEGPFINPKKKGAQDASAILPIDLGFARELIAAGNGKIKVMTFAPELKEAEELVELLCAAGVCPSMGHSVANDRQTLRAIDAGARHCTHLFNGMPSMHQRDLTLSNVALTDNRVTVEIIIDGRHVHPRMVDLACRCKPANQIIGISDCTMAAGMPDGEYCIGPSRIHVVDGFSQDAQRKLAGTTTMLDSGWHSLMSSGHLTNLQAAATVTRNAALHLELTDRGMLLPNKRADLAFYECGTNRPLMTVISGKIVYRAGQKESA